MRGDCLRGLGDELRKQQPDRFGASGERQGKGVRAILKSLGRALVLSAAAASVVGLAAAPALAATTWTVKPGGAVTAKAGKTVVNDVTAGLSVTCTSSTAKGTLKTGSGLAGKALGTFTSLAFSGCSAMGATVSVTIKTKMPLNGVSYNSTTKTASMTITGIHGKLTITSPISCSAVINGTSATANNGKVTATFTNATNTLKVLTKGSNLHLYNDTCPVTASGDAVNFTASYKFTPAQHIHSP